MSVGKLVYMQRLMALGGRRLSREASSLTLDPEAELKEANDFETPSKQYLKGLVSAPMTIEGQTSGAFERHALEQMSGNNNPQLFQLHNETQVGGLAIFRLVHTSGLKWTGGHSDVAGYSLPTTDYEPIHFGEVLHCPIGTSGVTETGTTPAYEYRAVGTDEKLVMAVNAVDPPGVLGTGSTLGIELQTHPDASFTVPVTRLASPTDITETGQILLELEGPISDTFYRLAWTVAGTNPVFFPMVALAIVPK